MKKLIILLMATLLIFTVSCAGEKSFPDSLSCEDILASLQVGDVPEYEKFYRKSESNLDSFSMSLWADGLYEECAEFDLLDDYSIFFAAGNNTYEIVVLKAKTENDVAALKGVIERRKQTLANGDKGMYDQEFETKMANSVLKTDGRFVIFLITSDNDAALKAAESLKG